MNRKGQSSIEYLTTYGWMLGVVAIIGAAIFATVQGQCVQSTSGFTGQDISIENFGQGEDGLSLEVRNTASSTVEIEEIVLEKDNNSVQAVENLNIDIGESEVQTIPGIERSDGCNSFDMSIKYDAGNIDNQILEASITDSMEIGDLPLPSAPSNPEVTV